ncbi:MAG: HlyD family efflux transporter periplasmic adaptor subunit [Planctomycetia bacterium]|nr:HlyD family efflux transporter periplasmic adaptor subunit [Planctomycetia bacterium]
MPDLATPLPCCRRELVFSSSGETGRYVVKDPRAGDYYSIGSEEYFLLTQLNGVASAETICGTFAERFDQPLAPKELEEFLDLAQSRGFLEEAPSGDSRTSRRPANATSARPRQSIVYWRKSLFDPNRLFTWLEPQLGFFWTRTFLVLSAGCILAAAGLVWANGQQLASSFAHALHWETGLWVWLVLLMVTTGHEFAHGLTCKHYGGEVHEVGFLMLLLMPCFYCNVSDAWLFREKSKRLWVTFAGGYFELFLWSLAVLLWRVTVPDSLVNYLAFVVLSVCGVKTLFNFNPLIKLDGYYLLSDWLAIPNLQQRAGGHFKGQFRRLLWGAPRPANEPRGGLLLGFGLASWLYSVVFLALMLFALFQFLWRRWGLPGAVAVLFLGLVSARGLFRGFVAGEVHNMVTTRRKRTILWLLGLGGLAAVLCQVEMEDRASGSFRLHPAIRAELRAPVAGFLTEIYFDEGDQVSSQALVARLEVPDLESHLAQKRSEMDEVQARLRLLEIGPRPEEVTEQRRRVERMEAWRDLAQSDLTHARQALQEELARLDKQIAQYRFELDAAKDAYERAQNVRAKGAIAEEQYREAQRKLYVAEAQLAQSHFQKRHREALGTREAIAGLDAEAELARRHKDLADAQATLTLMEAGSRPEEIEAERARLTRLQEEFRHLEEQRRKQAVASPVSGLVTTARLKEKVGQYLREGDLICMVEQPAGMEAEIALAEQDVAQIRAGQAVELKVRALPFETFATKVDRIAPAAGRGEIQGNVTVYCRLDDASADLRPEMTGYARVYTGRRPIGGIMLDRALRFFRTEFWW